MPRFTLVSHNHPFDHWDLFLEAGNELRTWRLVPCLDPEAPFIVEPTPNHRLEYLDYEGPISNRRGHVRRIDTGEFDWICDEPHQIAVQLIGSRFAGHLLLTCPVGQWSGQFDPLIKTT